MKRFVCALLGLVLILSLCACEADRELNMEGFHVGFGRVSITPEYAVEIAAEAASSRQTDSCQDGLYVTCIALTEGSRTYLIFTMDFRSADPAFVDPAKEAISKETGVKEENILMNATGTHSGVDIVNNSSKNAERYRKDFCAWATEAANLALEDRSPAEVHVGCATTQNMAHTRHYTLSNGTVAGWNFGNFEYGKITGHVSVADSDLQVVKFARAAEDKKDVVLMNFPAQPSFNRTSETLSADYPGAARDYVEANSDSLVAFFVAAAGDQEPYSEIAEETFNQDYKVYGAELGRLVVQTLNTAEKVEGTAIKWKTETFTAPKNQEGLDRLADAEKVASLSRIYGVDSFEATAAATQHGFSGVYEALSIVSRSKADEEDTIVLHAMSIGNLGFIFAPYDMFGVHSTQIKKNAPFQMTFVVTCSEGAKGYLPGAETFDYGCYEANVTNYACGTAEELAETFVAMLEELKK